MSRFQYVRPAICVVVDDLRVRVYAKHGRARFLLAEGSAGEVYGALVALARDVAQVLDHDGALRGLMADVQRIVDEHESDDGSHV